MSQLSLPNIIELTDFNGNYHEFEEFVYDTFRKNFIDDKPEFNGVKLRLKRYPYRDGREATYYHLITQGSDEENRQPDIRRMERIPWPKPIIDNSSHQEVKVWKNVRRGSGGTKIRISILLEREKYAIILDERDTYILFWTAFLVSKGRLKRMLSEYSTYIKTEAAK